jgi:hypothetical protein
VQEELTKEQALAYLSRPKPGELTKEQALARMEKSGVELPGKPGFGRSLVSGFLGGVAGMVDAAEAIGGALSPGGGILAGRGAPTDNPLASLSSDIRGAQELVTPPEERGRGNIFTEDVPEILGGMAPAIAAGAVNPALGAAAFGAQAGGPAYFEVVSAGGSPAEGMMALVGNAGLAQLERIGAGGAFTRAVKKLAGSPVGAKALGSLAAHLAVGGTKEVGTEALEQIGHDLILAGLTGQDVAVLDNAIATVTDPAIWTVGLLGAGAERAATRQASPAAPGAPQASGMAQGPTKPVVPPVASQEPLTQPTPGATPGVAPGVGQAGLVPQRQPALRGQVVRAQGPNTQAALPPPSPEIELEPSLARGLPYGAEQGASVLGRSAYFDGNQRTALSEMESGVGGADVLGGDLALPEGEVQPETTPQVSIPEEVAPQPQAEPFGIPEELPPSQPETPPQLAQETTSAPQPTTEPSAPSPAPEAAQEWDDDYADAKEIANGDSPEWASPRAKAWGKKLAGMLDEGKSERAWKKTLPERPAVESEAKKKKAKHKKRIDELLDEMSGDQEAWTGLNPEKLKKVAELASESIQYGYTSFKVWSDEMVAKLGARARPYLEIAWREAGGKIEGEAPQAATGIKNATVERELEAMGLPPPVGVDRVTDVERHARAKEKFDRDPFAGQRLLKEVEATGRAVTADEGALLAFEANRLKLEREAAQDAFNSDPSEANEKRVDAARDAYAKAADTLKRAGSESGSALRIRRMMIANDYSLAEMERRLQVAKGGKSLTAEESSEVARLSALMKEKDKAFEEYRAKVEPRLQELEAAVKEEGPRVGRQARRRRSIAESKKRIDEIIRKLGGDKKAAAGLDAEKVKLVGELAYESLKLGYNSFALWADDVVAKVGESVRPHLKGAWDDANARLDDEMLTRYKSRKRGDIARVEAKTEAGVTGKPRKTPIEKDPEALKLKADYEEARRKYERMVARVERANMTKRQKAAETLKEIVNLPREVLTSYDVSAPGRQGIFFMLGHPVLTAKHVAQMLSALRSERSALEQEVKLRNRPMYALGEAAGLELTSSGGLGPREEHMRSSLAEKIPGLGRGVAASNRAFVTFLSAQRAEMFDRMMLARPKDKQTLKDAEEVARFVNICTGRGDAGRLRSVVEGASYAIWSPSLLLSRFQILLPTHAIGASRETQKAMAVEYARTIMGISAIYAALQLADMADDEDEIDVNASPLSSDFGKVRIGDTRIDPLGGLSQVAVWIARMVTGKKMSSSGKIYDLSGDLKYGEDDAFDVTTRFLRSKAHPLLATAIDLRTGKNVVGEKITAKEAAKNLILPLSVKDIDTSLQEMGATKAVSLALISAFGFGVQTYSNEKDSVKK